MQALLFIRQYACQGIKTEQVAAHLGLSRSSLETYFRRELQRTVHDEILHYKLDRACTLLLPKLAATLLSTVLLAATAHAPLLFMAACAALTGAAGYIQHSLLDKSLLTVEDLEDDEEDTL
eukprot:gene33270-40251_t